jgi:hypothetical protein
LDPEGSCRHVGSAPPAGPPQRAQVALDLVAKGAGPRPVAAIGLAEAFGRS